MRRHALTLLVLLLAASSSAATPARQSASASLGPPPVHYRIAFSNRVHHEAEITATLRGLEPGPQARRRAGEAAALDMSARPGLGQPR